MDVEFSASSSQKVSQRADGRVLISYVDPKEGRSSDYTLYTWIFLSVATKTKLMMDTSHPRNAVSLIFFASLNIPFKQEPKKFISKSHFSRNPKAT